MSDCKMNIKQPVLVNECKPYFSKQKKTSNIEANCVDVSLS